MDNDNAAASNFNQFSMELRAKIDGLLKQVLLVSGGIQTITIGAFLSGKAPKIPTEAITLLQNGWLILSISIVCVLIFMLLQIIGLVQVGRLQVKKLESGRSGLEIIKGWKPLRMLNVLIGVTSVFLLHWWCVLDFVSRNVNYISVKAHNAANQADALRLSLFLLKQFG